VTHPGLGGHAGGLAGHRGAGLGQDAADAREHLVAGRQTIGDLMVATESAERAISGLRSTLAECDRTLAEP
jgi:hypothetical protein